MADNGRASHKWDFGPFGTFSGLLEFWNNGPSKQWHGTETLAEALTGSVGYNNKKQECVKFKNVMVFLN